jgi:hypothetical protein
MRSTIRVSLVDDCDHDGGLTHKLTRFGILLNVSDEFLLLYLKLCSFSIQLTLGFGERSLVLPQSLCRRHAPPKERLLRCKVNTIDRYAHDSILAIMFMLAERQFVDLRWW